MPEIAYAGYAHFGTAKGWTHNAVVLLTQIAAATSPIGLARMGSTLIAVMTLLNGGRLPLDRA